MLKSKKNRLCECGSGRKHKNCCGKQNKREPEEPKLSWAKFGF